MSWLENRIGGLFENDSGPLGRLGNFWEGIGEKYGVDVETPAAHMARGRQRAAERDRAEEERQLRQQMYGDRNRVLGSPTNPGDAPAAPQAPVFNAPTMGMFDRLFGGYGQGDARSVADQQLALNRRVLEDQMRSTQLDQHNPWGSSVWEGDGFDAVNRVTLNPADQQRLDSLRGTWGGMADTARTGIMPRLQRMLGQDVDFSGIHNVLGGQDLATNAQAVEDAMFQSGQNQLQPVFDKQRAEMERTLQNRGIPLGSEAYQDAMNRLESQQSKQWESLALSSVGAGRQEQSRLFDVGMRRRGQGIDEMMLRRNSPMNELAQMLAGIPTPGTPQFASLPQYSMPTPDFQGDVASRRQEALQKWGVEYGGESDRYRLGVQDAASRRQEELQRYAIDEQTKLAQRQQQQQQQQDMFGGLFGLLGSFI